MSEFVPIPGRPGYLIDPRGRVESEKTGFLLAVDKWGRVHLRQKGRSEYVYIGDLVLHAFPRASKAAPEAPQAARTEEATRSRLRAVEVKLKEARGALEKARKVNGHLIAQVNSLRDKLENAEESAPRRGRPPRGDSPPPLWDDLPDY